MKYRGFLFYQIKVQIKYFAQEHLHAHLDQVLMKALMPSLGEESPGDDNVIKLDSDDVIYPRYIQLEF